MWLYHKARNILNLNMHKNKKHRRYNLNKILDVSHNKESYSCDHCDFKTTTNEADISSFFKSNRHKICELFRRWHSKNMGLSKMYRRKGKFCKFFFIAFKGGSRG